MNTCLKATFFLPYELLNLLTSFLGLFYPTLKKELKSETMILGGGPCSQSVRHPDIMIALQKFSINMQAGLVQSLYDRH